MRFWDIIKMFSLLVYLSLWSFKTFHKPDKVKGHNLLILSLILIQRLLEEIFS